MSPSVATTPLRAPRFARNFSTAVVIASRPGNSPRYNRLGARQLPREVRQHVLARTSTDHPSGLPLRQVQLGVDDDRCPPRARRMPPIRPGPPRSQKPIVNRMLFASTSFAEVALANCDPSQRLALLCARKFALCRGSCCEEGCFFLRDAGERTPASHVSQRLRVCAERDRGFRVDPSCGLSDGEVVVAIEREVRRGVP